MRLINRYFGRLFRQLDEPILKLEEIRDSYRQLNVEIYGEDMARILNDF